MKPKKYLGQVFLRNNYYLKKIAEAVELEKDAILLEIGSGRGELTQFLVNKAKKLLCVEIDPRFCSILKERFKNLPSVSIFCQDIRNFFLPQEKIIVVGNIPYYLSFETVEFLIKNREKVLRAYLTFQKEFADKLTARVGSKAYSFLSCFLSFYAEAKTLFNIPKECFYPRPQVDASLVEIKLFSKPKFSLKASEKGFLDFLRKVFQERRKKLINILKKIYPYKRKQIEDLLISKKILAFLRPEKIELKDFVEIYNFLKRVF